MGNNSHTPGPWSVAWVRNTVYIKAENADKNLSVCRVMAHRNSNNVAILVNAPELLETCEQLLGFAIHYADPFALEAGNKLIESAKAIISKAKGAQHV